MNKLAIALCVLPVTGCAQRIADPTEYILREHDRTRIAHRLRDADMWVGGMTDADTLVSLNRGRLTHDTREPFLVQARSYFNSTRFLEWEDEAPPIILWPKGSMVASKVVQKRVRALTKEGESSVRFAWLEEWAFESGKWVTRLVASTDRPTSDPVSATVAQRTGALTILDRAKHALSANGDSMAAFRPAMFAYDADCSGPRGSYRMQVNSARDGRVSMRQSFSDGRAPWGAGVSMAGAWDGRERVDSLDASVLAMINGHEFILQIAGPETRYHAPALADDTTFDGRLMDVVRFADRTERPAWFYFDRLTSLPAGVRLSDPTDANGAPIDIKYDDYYVFATLRLPRRIRMVHGAERFDCAIKTVSTEWATDAVFQRFP